MVLIQNLSSEAADFSLTFHGARHSAGIEESGNNGYMPVIGDWEWTEV